MFRFVPGFRFRFGLAGLPGMTIELCNEPRRDDSSARPEGRDGRAHLRIIVILCDHRGEICSPELLLCLDVGILYDLPPFGCFRHDVWAELGRA